jgi:hypothetical protein
VAATAVAAVTGRTPPVLALVGPGARAAGRAAALGCGCLEARGDRRSGYATLLPPLADLAAAHRWAVLGTAPPGPERAYEVTPSLVDRVPPGAIVPATAEAADLAVARGDPWRVAVARAGAAEAATAAACGRALAAYLGDLCRRRLAPEGGNVTTDLTVWMRLCLTWGEQASDEGPAAALGRVLVRRVAAGALEVRPAGVGSPELAIVVDAQGGTAFVPYAAVARAYDRHGLAGPTPRSVGAALTAAGVAWGAKVVAGRDGWSVPAAWWVAAEGAGTSDEEWFDLGEGSGDARRPGTGRRRRG